MASTIKLGALSLCIVLLLLTCCAHATQYEEHYVRNIVLVHGVWVDGSSWKGVYDIFDYLDPVQYREYLAADLPAKQAAFMARSQVLIAGANF